MVPTMGTDKMRRVDVSQDHLRRIAQVQVQVTARQPNWGFKIRVTHASAYVSLHYYRYTSAGKSWI